MSRHPAAPGSARPPTDSADDDRALLRDYVHRGSENAFAQLVERHIGLVYSAAVRRCNGDAHRAEDIVQLVFTALAKNADTLSRHPALVGWLYTATRNATLNLQLADQRRARREFEAVMSGLLESQTTAEHWEELRHVLDRAMDELSETDRTAVLLRFFERRSYAEIGARLLVSESGARMRTERALDKLRTLLVDRGITSTAAAIGSVLLREAVGAVPGSLATVVTREALRAVPVNPGAAPRPSFSATKPVWLTATALIVATTLGVMLYRHRPRAEQPVTTAAWTKPDGIASAPPRLSVGQLPAARGPQGRATPATGPRRATTARSTTGSANASPADENAVMLLKRMAAAYAALGSYQDTGEVRPVDANDSVRPSTETFQTSFARPNRIRFESTRRLFNTTTQIIATFDGVQAATYISWARHPVQRNTGPLFLTTFVRATDGASFHIPRLLNAGAMAGSFSLVNLGNAHLLPNADVEGVRCYALEGTHPNGNGYRLWIGCDDLLIRKIVTTVPVSTWDLRELRPPPEDPDVAPPVLVEEIHRDIRVNASIGDNTFQLTE
jgi:RNA polymerase sigma factor (sigma-70 family)